MHNTVVKEEAIEHDHVEEAVPGIGDVRMAEEDIEDEEDDGEWEEITMVVTVNGILDADLVRDAVQKNLMKLRYAETDAPVLQINNSLYTGTWNRDLGTNIVLEAKSKELEVISCTSTMLTAEKALLTSVNPEGSSIAAKADAAPRAALSRTQPRGK